MTPAQRRALELLEAHEDRGLTPAEFARRMWPDSPAWQRPGKCGQGTSRGTGIRQAGGAFLARLRKAGLALDLRPARRDQPGRGYILSDAGLRALTEARKLAP